MITVNFRFLLYITLEIFLKSFEGVCILNGICIASFFKGFKESFYFLDSTLLSKLVYGFCQNDYLGYAP